MTKEWNKNAEKDKEIKNKEEIKQYPVLVVFTLSGVLGTCTGELIGRTQTCLSVAEPDVTTLLIPNLVIARDSEPVSAISLPCDPSSLFRYGSNIVHGSNSGQGKESFLFHRTSGRALGAHPASISVFTAGKVVRVRS